MKNLFPKMTAHRGDTDEKWRIGRLREGFDCAAALIRDADLKLIWPGAVRSLHDHKGVLFVEWRTIYDHGWYFRIIKEGWASLGDLNIVKHRVGADVRDPRIALGIVTAW